MKKICTPLFFWGSLLVVMFVFTGCFQEDLEEFGSIEGFQTERDYAIPLFEQSLTINDSLPFDLPEFTLADTTVLDLPLKDYLKDNLSAKLNYLEFKITIENNFPVDGYTQFYFTNENGTIVDSLFNTEHSRFMAADGSGYNYSTIYISMDQQKYQRILNSPRILMYYRLNTHTGRELMPYYMKVSTGLRFRIRG